MLFLSWLAVAEGRQQLSGICSLLGARSLQTEGNPSQNWQIQGNHEGERSGALCVQSHWFPNSLQGLHQGPPSQPWSPRPVLFPGGVGAREYYQQKLRESRVYFVPTSKMPMNIPPLARSGWTIMIHFAGRILFP